MRSFDWKLSVSFSKWVRNYSTKVEKNTIWVVESFSRSDFLRNTKIEIYNKF